MAGELAVDKVHRGLTLKYETIAKLTLKFGKPGETFSQILERVCDEITRDVRLPKDTLDDIKNTIAENYRKRMEKRGRNNRLSGL